MNIKKIAEARQRCIDAHPRKEELKRHSQRVGEAGRLLTAGQRLNSNEIIEILRERGIKEIVTADSYCDECQTIVAIQT